MDHHAASFTPLGSAWGAPTRRELAAGSVAAAVVGVPLFAVVSDSKCPLFAPTPMQLWPALEPGGRPTARRSPARPSAVYLLRPVRSLDRLRAAWCAAAQTTVAVQRSRGGEHPRPQSRRLRPQLPPPPPPPPPPRTWTGASSVSTLSVRAIGTATARTRTALAHVQAGQKNGMDSIPFFWLEKAFAKPSGLSACGGEPRRRRSCCASGRDIIRGATSPWRGKCSGDCAVIWRGRGRGLLAGRPRGSLRAGWAGAAAGTRRTPPPRTLASSRRKRSWCLIWSGMRRIPDWRAASVA